MSNSNNKTRKLQFFLKGEGSSRREHNINVVKNMIRKGMSFQEICKLSRKYFRPPTISAYYDIAQEEIAEEESNSDSKTPFTDYAKEQQKKRSKKK